MYLSGRGMQGWHKSSTLEQTAFPSPSSLVQWQQF